MQSYSADGGTNGLDCGSSSTISTYQGGSASFSSWNCVTTFGSGIPSSYDSYTWGIDYAGHSSSGTNVGSTIPISTTTSTINSQSISSGSLSGINCNYNATSNLYIQGGSLSLSDTYWDCKTTFSESGLPNPSVNSNYPPYYWNITFGSQFQGLLEINYGSGTVGLINDTSNSVMINPYVSLTPEKIIGNYTNSNGTFSFVTYKNNLPMWAIYNSKTGSIYMTYFRTNFVRVFNMSVIPDVYSGVVSAGSSRQINFRRP